jgi:hypothetical protein
MTTPPPPPPPGSEGEGGLSDFSSSKLRIEMGVLKAGAKSVSLEQRGPPQLNPLLSLPICLSIFLLYLSIEKI